MDSRWVIIYLPWTVHSVDTYITFPYYQFKWSMKTKCIRSNGKDVSLCVVIILFAIGTCVQNTTNQKEIRCSRT